MRKENKDIQKQILYSKNNKEQDKIQIITKSKSQGKTILLYKVANLIINEKNVKSNKLSLSL